MQAQVDELTRKLARQQLEFEETLNSAQTTSQRRLQELRDHFDSEVIPDIQKRHERRLELANQEAQSAKHHSRELQEKLLSLTNEVSALE